MDSKGNLPVRLDSATVHELFPKEKSALPELSTVEELAGALRVPVKTIYYWVSRSEIPYLKMGRHLRFEIPTVLAHFHRRTVELRPSCIDSLEKCTFPDGKLLFDNQGKNPTNQRKVGTYGNH